MRESHGALEKKKHHCLKVARQHDCIRQRRKHCARAPHHFRTMKHVIGKKAERGLTADDDPRIGGCGSAWEKRRSSIAHEPNHPSGEELLCYPCCLSRVYWCQSMESSGRWRSLDIAWLPARIMERQHPSHNPL